MAQGRGRTDPIRTIVPNVLRGGSGRREARPHLPRWSPRMAGAAGPSRWARLARWGLAFFGMALAATAGEDDRRPGVLRRPIDAEAAPTPAPAPFPRFEDWTAFFRTPVDPPLGFTGP